MILLLTRLGEAGFKSKYPLITNWISNMSDIQEMMSYEEQLAELIDSYEQF